MATAVEPRPATKSDAAVERNMAAAADKVRANDLFTGAAVLALAALAYVVGMVILDKWLVLPDWVRQLGFVGFLTGMAALAYFAVARPLQRRVNPRYIARQVEQTIPDAKNELINWVDLQDRELPDSVKTAVATRAANSLADADVDSATRSRRLVWLASAAGVLLVVLAALFLVFKWAQFSSLVGRAVNPFGGGAIATRTQLDLLEPLGGNATVTDGEQLNIAVHVGGRIPDATGPDQVRLRVRHNPESDEYDDIPLVRGETSREYSLAVPRSVIQNGFWYKVAGGDAETPEFRVNVRSRAMIVGFQADYEYPAYLKWPASSSTDSRVRDIRGTAVTLVVKSNRELTSGAITVTAGTLLDTVRGEVTGEKRDALRFRFKLTDSGTYRVQFKPAGEEPAFASSEYPIEVEIDQPPRVAVTSPKEDEAVLPANGLLAVDATIADDFGIVSAGLRLKVVGRDAVVIPVKKYRGGKPFKREKDGTFETDLPDYKDSVKLDAITDEKGQPVLLKADDVLEYWVEATDNCTEPKANVRESLHKRVRLTAPVKEPEKKAQQDKKRQDRQGEEKKAEQNQDKRQQNDTRPAEQGANPDPNKQPPQPDQKAGDPMQPKQEDGKQDTTQGGGGGAQNDQKTKTDNNPKPDQKGGQPDDDAKGGQPGEDQKGTPPSDQDIQRKADEIKNKIDDKKAEPGDAKGDGNTTPQGTETKPNAQQKPGDAGNKGGEKEAAQEKGDGKTDPTTDPKAGESKDPGTLTQPDRAEQKPAPKDGAKGSEQPTGEKPKEAPKDGAEPGAAKDSKPADGQQPMDPMNPMKGDKKGGEAGDAKVAQPQPGDKTGADQQPMGGGNDKADAKHPDDLSGAKDKGDPERGSAKPTKTEKKAGGSGDKPDQPNPEEKGAGDAKGDKPMTPGAKKDAQPDKNPDGSPMEKKGPPPDASEEKKGPPNGDGTPMGKKDDAAEPKGGDSADKQPMGGDDKGNAKESPTEDDPKGGRGQPDKTPKQPGGPADPNEKPTRQEIDDAIRELDSENPGSKAAAQQKLDKAMGKQNRETVERLMRDAKTGTAKQQEQAKKDIDELAKKNSKPEKSSQPEQGKPEQGKPEQGKPEQGKPEQGKPEQGGKPDKPDLTEQEKKDLAEAAQKLNSKDDAERKAAEQKLDEQLGKGKREELQQDLKDLAGNDPDKAQKAKEKLEKLAQQAKGAATDATDPTGQPKRGSSDKPGKPIDADPENLQKTRELQLDEFKKYRGDKKFLKENNLTEQEFDRFLKGFEEMVTRGRDDLDQKKLNGDPLTPPTGRAGIRNDASTERLKVGGAEAGSVGGSGASVAPPGFADAQRRFAEEAAKRQSKPK